MINTYREKKTEVEKTSCLILQANSIINSLTASVCKVQGALAELNGHNKPHVWLMTYVQTTKDKQVSARERERERERDIYIYIYIERERDIYVYTLLNNF